MFEKKMWFPHDVSFGEKVKNDGPRVNVFNPPGKTFTLPTQQELPEILTKKFPVSYKNSPFLVAKKLTETISSKKCKENIEMHNKIFDEHLDMLVSELESKNETKKATFVRNVRKNYLSTIDSKVEKYITTELFGMKNIRGKKDDPLYRKMKRNDKRCERLMESIDKYSTTGISLAEYSKIKIGEPLETIDLEDILYSESEAKKRTKYNLNKIRDEIIQEMKDVIDEIGSNLFGIKTNELVPPSPMVANEIAGFYVANEFIHCYKYEPEKLKLENPNKERIGPKFESLSSVFSGVTNAALGGLGFTLALINKIFDIDCMQNYVSDTIDYWFLFYAKFDEYVKNSSLDPGVVSFLSTVKERIIDQISEDIGLTQDEIQRIKNEGSKLTEKQMEAIRAGHSITYDDKSTTEKIKDLLKNVGIFVLCCA